MSVKDSIFRYFGAVLISCLLIVEEVSAQQPNIQFTHLSLEQGLSQSSVCAIVQDHQGFLWFGTQDGLDRYDGYDFKVFRHNPHDSTSISYNFALRLFVDSKGNIWVGTSGGGLNCYNPGTNRFRRFIHDDTDPGSLSDNTVYRIYEDPRGAIWVATANGLDELDQQHGTFEHYFSNPHDVRTLNSNLVSSIFKDSKGRLWVGTSKGVALYRGGGLFSRIPGMNQLINCIFEDNAGTIWFIGEAMYRYDPIQNRLAQWLSWGGGSEYSLYNGDGTFWVGTYGGLMFVDTKTRRVTTYRHDPNNPQSLSENTVLSLCKDRSGILWIGTYQGVNKFVPTAKKFDLFVPNPKNPNSLSSPRVRGFAQDRTGAIWVGTQDGLNRFDRKTGDFIRYFGPPRDRIPLKASHFWTVIVDQFSSVPTVLGGTNGQAVEELSFPSGRSWSNPVVRNYPSDAILGDAVVSSLLQDRSGTIWIGEYGGAISKYNRRTGQLIRVKDPDNHPINALYEDRTGTLWAGGYTTGLIFLKPGTKSFQRYFQNVGIEQSVAANSALCMTEDSSGTLWVGTNEGLLRIKNGKLLEQLTVQQGLPNNVIYGILSDDKGNLWFSSNRGITRYSIAASKITDFTENDGLQSNEFNQGAAFRARNGEMYFGGISGFNVFNPDSIKDNPNVPTVALTEIKVFNKALTPSRYETRLQTSAPLAKKLTLDYRDNVLTFDFAALEFTDPVNNLYAYTMAGFDKDWVSAGTRREATYTNLESGTYTFRVKASNNDGIWNESGTSITVTILPPYWMTWWFRSIVILAFLSVGPVIYVRRTRAFKKETNRQREFSRRLIQSQEQERTRIAKELHDGLSQDLLVVKNRAELGLKNVEAESKASRELREISQTASQAIRDVRAIAHNLRPYQLDSLGLTDAVRATVSSVVESSGMTLHGEIGEINGLFAKEQEVSIFRIVQETTNNIVKHANASEVWCNVFQADGLLRIEIRDNGKGFDVSSLKGSGNKGFGLSGIAERVRMMGGTHELTSMPGKGTTHVMTFEVTRE